MKIGIISTSANPLHAGHLAIAEWGVKHDFTVVFDISRHNADKGQLDDLEVNRRNAQVVNAGYDVINLTESAFCHKIDEIIKLISLKRLPYDHWDTFYFFVGMDTAERIGDVKYYGSEKIRDKLLSDNNLHFVVFERGGKSDLSTLCDVMRKKSMLADGYVSIDISSTEIRKGLKC